MSSERNQALDEGIIAAGPWKDVDCVESLPYRAVLRLCKKPDEVVVHTQIKNRDGSFFFEHGLYMPTPLDIDTLKKAVADMERR